MSCTCVVGKCPVSDQRLAVELGMSDRHLVVCSREFSDKKLEVKPWSCCLGK